MKNKKLIIYVHGWNSHKKARKAVLIADELKSNIDFEVCSLTLHHHPREAISQLTEIIEMEKKKQRGLSYWKLTRGLFLCLPCRKIQFESCND